jgi:hypothetical protein
MDEDALSRLTRLPGVFEAVDAARGSVDVLLRELRGRDLRRRVPEVTAESLRRGAWASACLEAGAVPGGGSIIGPVEAFHAPFGDDVAGATSRGALRLTTELSSLSQVWTRAPSQALARLHTLAAADLVADEWLGRPRPDAGVADRLAALSELVIAPTEAPAVVVSAIVLGELLGLQPFVGGNGLVARAAARIVLLERGLDPQAASVPEAGLLELGSEATAAALAGYLTATADGVAAWIGHWAHAVALGGRAGRDVAAGLLAG